MIKIMDNSGTIYRVILDKICRYNIIKGEQTECFLDILYGNYSDIITLKDKETAEKYVGILDNYFINRNRVFISYNPNESDITTDKTDG